MLENSKTFSPGLLDPLDNNAIISPGEIVGGDTILLISSLASYDSMVDYSGSWNEDSYFIGLVQGISINSSRMVRAIHQVGTDSPMLISSVGQKSMNTASVLSEDDNLINALYKCTIDNRQQLLADGVINEKQKAVLDKYARIKMTEGLPKDLMRIPFGLKLMFMSGAGDLIASFHLGHCMLTGDNNTVEAGTRGIGESNGIMWQKTTTIQV